MFKSRFSNFSSLTLLLITLISFGVMFVDKKIGGIMLMTIFVVQLVTGMTIYYVAGKNTFLGRSKKRTSQETLEKQKFGLKILLPMFITISITFVLIMIYYFVY